MRRFSCSLIVKALILISCLKVIPPGHSVLLEVTVFSDKVSYLPNENITIYGNLKFQGIPVEENGLVGLQVDDPAAPILLRTVNVGPYSAVSIVDILSVTPCDFYLNPKSRFERGEEAYFYVIVKNKDAVPRSALITASVFEGSNRPLATPSTIKITMDPGSIASARFGPVVIPIWATTGEARVYANVFSDWPKERGIPYCPEKSASFNIIGLEYESSSTSESADSSFPSLGHYELKLKLSPESRSGQYRIHASGNYKGFSAYSTRLFMVPAGPYPPQASFEYIPRPESWVGVAMTFDASTSVAIGYEDRITKYKWDFGDGTVIESTKPRVTKIYNAAGTYLVTLNVTDNEGLWNATSRQITVLTEKRDIALTRIQSLTEIYADWTVYVAVTVRNLGGPRFETFDVRLLCNTSLLQTLRVTNLAPWPYGVITINFTWDTAGLTPYVTYVLKAEADMLADETNIENNIITIKISKVKMLGDVTGDKIVNIYDVASITAIYGVKVGDPKWNVQADLVRDNVINIYDVTTATIRYGQKYGG